MKVCYLYVVFLGKYLISWKSKKQTIVSRCSSESKYRALASLTCKIQLLHYLFTDLRITFTKPTSIYCDNRSVVYLARNPTFHERCKHIEIYCHIIREELESGLTKLFSIASSTQIISVLTEHRATPTACEGVLDDKNS